METTKLRPYRVVDVVDSEFLKANNDKNEKFCIEDLAKSGLTPDDILAAAPGNLKLHFGADVGYQIPYWDKDGRIITCPGNNYNSFWRTKLGYNIPTGAPKYHQTDTARAQEWGLPSYIPYLIPFPKEWACETIYCIEGEKKTAAFIKHLRLPAFGVPGCQMWGDPDHSGSVHSWITGYLGKFGVKKVVLVPDADVLRYDISRAYGNFAEALTRETYIVEILRPPGKIDDIIVEWLGQGKSLENLLGSLERLESRDLVQTPAMLAKHYNLAYKQTKDGVPVPYQNRSNMMILLENHNAFPKIRTNLDTNKITVGDDEAVPDVTEMDILCYFQHNCGFDKAKESDVLACIKALARENQWSPMLDHIRSLQWDGIPRVATWFQDYWGVEDTPYVREVGTKWLISICARLDKPGCDLGWMLAVIGPQGTGKTSMPRIFLGSGYIPIFGDTKDKDFLMQIVGHLCVGFDELDIFNKKDMSMLKALITRSTDEFRPPYGRTVEQFPRRSTLYGSGNHKQWLQYDSSGYRRYSIIEVNRILDFGRLEAVRDQLWAEAWSLYCKGGINWWEVEGNSEHAQEYVIPNVLQEKVFNWIEAERMNKHSTSIKDGKLWFTMSRLLEGIGEGQSARNSGLTREIAAILKEIGCQQKHVRIGQSTSRMYYLSLGD